MVYPTFDGDQVATEGYGVLSGRSSPFVVLYPRTVGGILQESGVVTKRLNLRSYLIPPSTATRKTIEEYCNSLNEQIGTKEANLILNGNTYLNCNVENIDYDLEKVKNYIRYTIGFIIGDQNTGGSVRQLSVSDLLGFTRGRVMTFQSTLDDFTNRTFTFWHNTDKVRNFETQITVTYTDSFGGGSRIIRVGGFERIRCECWILGLDEGQLNRKNLEAYFYNMINGPLGRLGTLVINGETLKNCFFESASMSDETGIGINYNLSFLKSLAC